MKFTIISAAAFLFSSFFMACQNSSDSPTLSSNLEKIEAINELPGTADTTADRFKDMAGDQDTIYQQDKKQIKRTDPQPKIDWDKKIIKTATLNAEVTKYDEYYATLREKVRSVGGYVAQEAQSQSDYKIENAITIKVPVDQFDNALSLFSTGVKINERTITSQDVTGEVVDIKSRMEAKKHVRDRYVDLLKQAKNMGDILSVQSEINGIQEEIESASGRVSYLSHAAVFSTINLTFFQVLDISVKEKENPSIWTRLAQSFKTGWSWLIELIIGLTSIWPLLVLILIIWRLVKRYTRPIVKSN